MGSRLQVVGPLSLRKHWSLLVLVQVSQCQPRQPTRSYTEQHGMLVSDLRNECGVDDACVGRRNALLRLLLVPCFMASGPLTRVSVRSLQ